MADQAVPSSSGGGKSPSKPYESVLPELGRLLLSQHLPSIDGKVITVDDFSAAVQKATNYINDKKVFAQLRIDRPDYIQYLIDREVWEAFYGGPDQKDDPNYKAFSGKDPRKRNPLPQYFEPGTLTPDSYGLIFRDNLHPDCPNCTCGQNPSTVAHTNHHLYDDGGIRASNPQLEFAGFKKRLEAKTKEMGYKDLEERWEKECEIEQAKKEERDRKELEGTQSVKSEGNKQVVEVAEESKTLVKKKDKKLGKTRKARSGCFIL